MSSTSEHEVGLEAKINPVTLEVGIGVTVKRKGAKTPTRLSRFFSGDDNVALDKDLVEDIIKRAREYPRPDVSQFAVGGYWQRLQQQPSITAVVSGKGGVGKTSIALGLAELYSVNDNVLIVDFDLHNRGLTSKYGPLTKEATTVLDEMKRFSKTVLVDERLPRESGRLVLSKFEENLFHDLREKYCYTSYPAAMQLAELKLEHLYQPSVRNAQIKGSARPQNCYFLPSRRGGESYLGTRESLFDVAEIAIFLTYLGCLAFRHKITKIVLDCHGAHDLFMVGAILASSNLVVVTRPEPAAFEGTIELVRFAESIVESKSVFPSKRTLVFNEYRDADRMIAETLFNALYADGRAGENFESLPRIESSNEIRDLFKYYSEPSLLQHPTIGPAIARLGG